MVRINDKKFKVYTIDTKETIMERIASDMNTLPQYLFFPEGEPDFEELSEIENIKVIDVRSVIMDPNFGLGFSKLYERVRPMLSQDVRDSTILEIYLNNNPTITDVDKSMVSVYLLTIESDLKALNINNVDLNDIIENRERQTDGFEKIMEANKKKVKIHVKLADTIETMVGVEYTKFELEKVNFDLTLNIKNISIMEIFNQIQLNSGVPFACINGFFKILKDFTPEEEWSGYLQNAIIMKVLQKPESRNVKPSDYTDIILANIIGTDNMEELTAGMTLSTSNQYLTRDQLIERFTDTLKGIGKINATSIKESYVNGVFYFPKHTMDKYIMSDLIMNDPLFSNLLAIDESDKASKSKASIYVHFKHPVVGEVTANITEKISDREDQSLRGKDMKDLFEIGSKYIRVKISSARDIKSVEFFQGVMSKLFKIYDEKYKSLMEFYKRFIPDFGKEIIQAPKQIRKLKLKDKAPEVFINRYPTKCPSQPTIIEDDEVEAAIALGKEVMKYPQTNEEGFEPRNYVCDHEDAKYPGLRSNPLSNNDIVPYLPCCYEKKHSEKAGSIYRHYYFGEELASKEDKEQQDFITTNKFVDRNNFGTLPSDISKVFKLLSDEEGYMYVRKGVLKTESSFLNCVMEGMHEETGILDYDDASEIEAFLYQTREELATAENAAAARQEMYDYTNDEITKILSDGDTYLEPKLFISMLEKIYKCNIFVFNRNRRNGELMLPRHLQAYYKTKNPGKCIFIYEHTGTGNTPRCELIVKWKVESSESSDLSYYEEYNSDVSVGIRRVFNEMKESYSLNKKIQDIEFPITFDLVNQTIDTYGKIRMLQFKADGKTGTILTDPMDPMILPSTDVTIIPNRINIADAIDFAEKHSIQLNDQIVSNGIVKELNGKIGNVNISIPVNDTEPIPGMNILEYGIRYPETVLSDMKNYNKYKKLARYITEYMFWLYSKFIDSSQGSSIEDFVKKYIVVIPSFEYGQVNKNFSMDSGVMKNSKLVVKSEETLKRLIYVLRLKVTRDEKLLLLYKNREFIEKFYEDVTDFDQSQSQVILEGDESVEKWIKEKKTSYYLHDDVQVTRRTPYFFKNNLVGDQIYLAQNTNSQYTAIKIAETWYSEGYNPGEDVEEGENVSFTLFSYVNKYTIKQYNVKGPDTPYDIRMLGYKIEDMNFFTVLLPFNN